jgi:hypothetical protein
MPKAETALVAGIIGALAPLTALVLRVNSGKVRVARGWMQLAPPGTPDIIGALKDGRFFAIEAKTAKGKPEESQLDWRRRADRAGLLHGEARTVGEAVALVREWRSV